MKKFMDEKFLLSTETAWELYQEYASKMPVLDYHCHIEPKEIAEDRRFENITQLWLEGDHYKWRQMRSNGIDERYITGNASDWDKFLKWAETLEKAIGNPLYHWSHLELQRYFGYQGVLNRETAQEVWDLCNHKIKEEEISARKLLQKSNVTLLCTTDDLKYHKQIREDKTFGIQVLPAWRPEAVMEIASPGYKDYIERLGSVADVRISTFEKLKTALARRMDYFKQMGCRISDHSLSYAMYIPASFRRSREYFCQGNSRGKDIL